MTVHHHDPDRIMALAAGTLPQAEARFAASEVAGCPRCSADLDQQRIALTALAALVDDPAAALTDLESRRLRRALHDELGLAPAAPAEAARRRGFSWGPLVAVAAVFLAVVVGGNAIRSLSPGGDDDTAADLVAADQTTSGEQRTEATTAPEAVTDEADEEASRQGLSPASTAAPAEDTAGMTFAGGATESATAEVTLDDLAVMWDRVVVDRSALTESAVSGDAPDLASMVALELDTAAVASEAADDACAGAAAAFVTEPTEIVVVGTVVLADLGPTVLVVAAAPDGTARLLVHDPGSCAVVTEVPSAEHP
jgi:hypothetical protein